MIPSYKGFHSIDEAKSTTGAKYKARLDSLLKRLDSLDTEFRDLQIDLTREAREGAPTPALKDRLENLSSSLKGNLRYTLDKALKYGREVSSELASYDEESSRVTSIRVPKPDKLVEFLSGFNRSGFALDVEDVNTWAVDLLAALPRTSGWFEPTDSGSAAKSRVNRAMARSVSERAAADYREKTGKRWDSNDPFGERASSEDKERYAAKYVKELNKYLRPYGVESSPTSMVFFDKLNLRKKLE